jgi:hypothetical protein
VVARTNNLDAPPSVGNGTASVPVFRQLLAVSEATQIQAQTNDALLMLMVYDFATDISRDRTLFQLVQN